MWRRLLRETMGEMKRSKQKHGHQAAVMLRNDRGVGRGRRKNLRRECNTMFVISYML